MTEQKAKLREENARSLIKWLATKGMSTKGMAHNDAIRNWAQQDSLEYDWEDALQFARDKEWLRSGPVPYSTMLTAAGLAIAKKD